MKNLAKKEIHIPNQNEIDAVCEAIAACNKSLRLAVSTESSERKSMLMDIAACDDGCMLDLALIHLRRV